MNQIKEKFKVDKFNRSRIEMLNQSEIDWLLNEYNTTNIDVASVQFWYEKFKNYRPNTRCFICNKELQHKQVRKECVQKKDRVCQIECRKESTKITNIKKYGGVAPACNQDVLNKMKSTNLERYGNTSYTRTQQFKKKFKKTCLEKYGVDQPFKLQEFRDKASKTYYERTGYTHNQKNPEFIRNREKYWIDKHGVKQNLCLIDPSKYKRSKQEIEIEEFIIQTGLVNKNDIKIQDRTILKPLEIDILIKQKNFAIEFNGNHQHQIIYKDKLYHLEKTRRCEEQGIRLIHIWYEDYIKDKEKYFNIIKSYLSGVIPIPDNPEKLERDLYSKLDFPDYIEIEPEMEICNRQKDKIFRTGYLIKVL